jgi:hypothetical protein
VRSAAVCAALLAVLCLLSPPARATNAVPPGRILSLIPSDDEVSQYVGLPMHHLNDPVAFRPRDPDHLDQRDECRTLVFDNTVDVWGSDYTAYRAQNWNYQPDPQRMFVNEAVGIFASPGAAQDRFNAVYGPNIFNTCNHAVFQAPLSDPGVMIELYDFKLDDGFVAWTLAVKVGGLYTGYNLVHFAWHLANVMAISLAQQDGNPAPTVRRLTDHILDRLG